MVTPRIYIDTSVLGGCFDPEYKEESLRLFDEFIEGQKIAVVSDLVLFELEDAPDEVRQLLTRLPPISIEYVALNEDSLALAKAYLQDGAVAESSQSDARHIAMATVNRVDVLVSWNFKHIVNLSRIRRFNAVNLKLGYMALEIRSPREVLNEK